MIPTETPTKVTDEMVKAGHAAALGRSMGDPATYRRIIAAALDVSSEPLVRTLLGVPAGHGAPHHDGDKIRPGDFVVQVDADGCIRAWPAHRQDAHGNWRTEDGWVLTWAAKRADRPDALTIWPAEEVELPERMGAVIEGANGGRIQATAGGVTYTAAEAIYHEGMWYGAWRTASGGTGIQFSSSSITPGTWQGADQ